MRIANALNGRGGLATPLFSKRTLLPLLAAVLVTIAIFGSFVPTVHATTFPVGPPVTIVSNTGHLEVTYGTGTCSYQGFMYAFYVEPATGNVYWSVTTIGVTWSNPVVLLTLTSPMSTTATLLTSGLYKQTCNGQTVLFAWFDNSLGGSHVHIDYAACSVGAGTVTCLATVTQQPLSKANGTPINQGGGSTLDSIDYLNGLTFITFTNNGVGRGVAINGISSSNTTTINAQTAVGWVSGGTYIWAGQGSSTQFEYSYTTNSGTTWHCCTVINSLNGGSLGGLNAGISSGQFVTINNFLYLYYWENHSGGNCATTACLESVNFNAQGALYNQVTIGDVAANANTLIGATTDGVSQIVVVAASIAGNVGSYAYTSNGQQNPPTYVINNYLAANSNGGSAGYPGSMGETFSPQLGAFAVETGTSSGTFNVYAQIFGTPNSGATSCTGAGCTGTSGSGPITPGTTYKLASNDTMFYLGTTTQQAGLMITNVTVKIASITWSSGSIHHIFLGIWQIANPCPVGHTCGNQPLQGNTGTIGPSNPLVMTTQPVFQQVYALGNTASPFFLHFLPTTAAVLNGTYYAVGLGTDHNGVVIYGAANGNMFNDTSDGYSPLKINSAVTATHNLWLQYTWFMPSVTVNLVTQVVSGSVTTSTTTVFCNSGAGDGCAPQGGQTGVLFEFFLLFFTIPVTFIGILGKLAGAGGALMGAILGLVISTAIATIFLGLSPTYLVLFGVTAVLIIILLIRGGGLGGGGGAPSA